MEAILLSENMIMKYVYFFLATLLFVGCYDQQVSDYKLDLNYKYVSYNLDLSVVSEVTTKGGIKVKFDQDVTNRIYQLINDYSIELRINEFYNIKDIVFNGLSTVTVDNELLETAGMFNIDIFHDGVEVDLKSADGISIDFPLKVDVANPLEYKIFEGVINEEADILWTNPIDIDSAQLTTIQWTETIRSVGPNYVDTIVDDNGYRHEDIDRIFGYINIKPATLNWINVDRFYEMNDSELAELKINVANVYEDMKLGVILSNTNSYMSLYFNNVEGGFNSSVRLPIGEQVIVVSFGHDGNNYLLANAKATVGDTNSIELVYDVMKDEDLSEDLK